MTRGTLPWIAALLALAPHLAFAQADLGPRTPVEGGAIIMPEDAPPPQDRRKPEARRDKPSTGQTKSERPPPAGKQSRQDDCKGSAAQCKQDTAR